MDQTLIQLYDDYTHRHFNRRLFLKEAARHAGSMAAAVSALALLQSNYAMAAVVPENDTRIKTSRITYPGASGPMKAYLALPAGNGKHGAVLVIHQNRGLNPHIEDVTRRLAVAGYVAMGVDFLSPLGGTPVPAPGKPVDGAPMPAGGWPADESAAMGMFGQLDRAQAVADAVAGVSYLRARPDVNDKVGAIGFCWGGGIVNQLAVADPTLNAGDVYYGGPARIEDVPKIKAPLLLNYADAALDKGNGQAVPPYAEALRAHGKTFDLHWYPGANHAFNDDTSARYEAKAATLAWERTLAFFGKYLA